MGYKDFAVGEVLTSQDVDNFLMRQTVMVFDDSASRATAIGTAIAEGMTSYLKDIDSLEYYDGSSWLNVNDNTDAIPKAVLAAQGDLIYGASAGSAAALSIGTAGQFLTTNGTVPSWTDISTAGDIITTQGDLIIGDASGDPSRLAIGTADQVLTSNGTTISWADAGGGGKDWTVISTVSPGTAVSSVDFTGLSGKDSYYLSVDGLSGTQNAVLSIQVNNDTNSIYTYQGLKIVYGSTYSGNIFYPISTTAGQIELAYVDDATDTYKGGWELSGATGSNYKVFSHVVAAGTNGVADGDQTTIYKGYINLAAAITSIKISINNGTFDAGTVTLLGA